MNNIDITTSKLSKRHSWLFVLPWSLAHLGGVNQVVINLAREMLRVGSYEPIILISDWDAIEPIWEVINGLRTVRWRVRPFNTNPSVKERISFVVWERRFRIAFEGFCKEHRVAVVNCQYADPTAFTFHRITRGHNSTIPMIISFHGADLTTIQAGNSVEKAQWKQLLMQDIAIVACSKALGRRIVDTFSEKLVPTIIHNGLDSSAFVSMASTSTFRQGRTILNVGKFEDKKGQDVLIRAFATITNEYDDLTLVLVGATDKALPRLRELCSEKGIGTRVLFYPDTPHSEVANLFRQATIFALPSRQEPFGIVLLEAGSFSLPVVATNVGGIPEILIDGVTGRLVSPNDPEELAIVLRSLLDDPDAANAMGKRLKDHVASHFTWTAAHDSYLKLVTA